MNFLKKRNHLFSRVLRDTTPRFVRPSVRRPVGRLVGWSVGRSVGPNLTFFMFLRSLASLHLPKCLSNSNTAPSHPHATKVAVYPALFKAEVVGCNRRHSHISIRLLKSFSILISEIFSPRDCPISLITFSLTPPALPTGWDSTTGL